MEPSIDTSIVATCVPEAQRLSFLPRHFGRQMMILEEDLYTHMSELCADYSGGYWNFYDLSNGGCYLAPSGAELYRISVSGNGFEGSLSADAAGITATLFAMNTLTFRFPRLPQHAERYYQLRDFAYTHTEARLILAAID
jgi:hypothetical protein